MIPARDLARLGPPLRRLRHACRFLLAEREELRRECRTLHAQLAGEKAGLAVGAANPFYHYNAIFDAVSVMHRHAVAGLKPRAGYLTNFLGVVVNPKFFPNLLANRSGEVEPVPIPANWHSDIAEWGAALRAVDLAQSSFTMIELGCGWGCWMNNTGVAARRAGLNVHLIGVESDAGHIAFAEEACRDNGFQPAEVTLRRGVAAAEAGIALFPRQDRAGIFWGWAPVFGATASERADALRSGRYDELPMIPLKELAASHERIDLLHVDIQGGEVALVAGSLPILDAKIAYLLVGTHSRQIEGRLFDILLAQGWRLEIERPAILAIGEDGPLVSVDGVQGWRNPRLLPRPHASARPETSPP